MQGERKKPRILMRNDLSKSWMQEKRGKLVRSSEQERLGFTFQWNAKMGEKQSNSCLLQIAKRMPHLLLTHSASHQLGDASLTCDHLGNASQFTFMCVHEYIAYICVQSSSTSLSTSKKWRNVRVGDRKLLRQHQWVESE